MGKATGIPVAVIRGVDGRVDADGRRPTEIVRPPHEDLFR